MYIIKLKVCNTYLFYMSPGRFTMLFSDSYKFSDLKSAMKTCTSYGDLKLDIEKVGN